MITYGDREAVRGRLPNINGFILSELVRNPNWREDPIRQNQF